MKYFRFKIIPILILSLILSIFQYPLTSRADYNGGQGENGVGVGGTLKGGPSVSKTGIQLYIVDRDTGTPLVSDAGMIFRDSSYETCKYKIVQTKLGRLGWGKIKVVYNLPYPLVWTGSSWKPNGNAVKSWLLEKGSGQASGYLRYEYLVKILFGEAILEEIQRNPEQYSLVVEPLAWMYYYVNDNGTYIPQYSPLLGTADGWAKIYNEVSRQSKGDLKTYKMSHSALPYSMVLETERFGLAPHAGEAVQRLDGNVIRSSGYGIHIIDLKSDAISTWDRVNYPLTPGPSPSEPSGGKINIIKNYYTADNNDNFISDDGCYYVEDAVKTISIEDEKKYKVVSWKISDTKKTDLSSKPDEWSHDIPGNIFRTGTTPETVKLNGAESNLYVLLKRVKNEEPEPELTDANYVLSESSISRRIWLSNPDARLSMTSIQDNAFKWNLNAHTSSCSGHSYSHTANDSNCTSKHYGSCNCSKCPDGCSTDHNGDAEGQGCTTDHAGDCDSVDTWTCNGHTDTCTGWKWHDNSLKLSIINELKSDYPDILSSMPYNNVETTVNGLTKRLRSAYRSTTNACYYSINGWDYVCIIHRGKDKLTVADWKNETAVKYELMNMSDDVYTVANNSTSRLSADYIDMFSVNFINDTSTDRNTIYGPSTAGANSNGKCNNTTTWAELESPLAINNIKVKVEVYSGDANASVNDTSVNTSEMLNLPIGGYNKASGRMISSGATISFIPYIRMKYDNILNTDKTAYVLGQHERSITPNSYAEICWNEKDDANLSLVSPQWSTHAQAIEDFGALSVLPGGAQLGLEIETDNRQVVNAVTYQVVVKDNFKNQVTNDGGLTEEAAISAHKDFAETVRVGLDNLVVQQYVDKDNDRDDAFRGIQVNAGEDISYLRNGASTASTDSKYYFKVDGENNDAIQGDLDVSEGVTATTYIKISADTSGNIKVNDEIVLTKDQDYTMLTGYAKLIDEKTYIIRKLDMALERNSGSDKSATWISDGKWYNEAVDDIYIMVQSTRFQVGFGVPSYRVQILDPKLIPKTTKKKEMFTDYFISQFKVRDYSEAYNAQYEMGTFKGYSIKMRDVDRLFWSKPFYIPNVTVQDLH